MMKEGISLSEPEMVQKVYTWHSVAAHKTGL